MLQVYGLLVIPKDPKKSITASSKGSFLNFQAVSQGKTVESGPDFQYWDCSVWLPEDRVAEWNESYIVPGSVLYLESATANSVSILEGKYHNTKIRLDFNKTKKLVKPVWLSDK